MGFIQDLLKQFLPQILSSLQDQGSKEMAKPEAPLKVVVAAPPIQGIDWSNPDCKVSQHFTVKEMLWLPTWHRMANEQDGLDDKVKANLIDLAKSMDIVREYFGKSINVHVTYRPLEYNKAIGGALHSAHSEGGAMDFDVVGMNCDDARKKINDDGMLEKWQMRMEDISALASRNWVHLDRRQPAVGGHRFFKP